MLKTGALLPDWLECWCWRDRLCLTLRLSHRPGPGVTAGPAQTLRVQGEWGQSLLQYLPLWRKHPSPPAPPVPLLQPFQVLRPPVRQAVDMLWPNLPPAFREEETEAQRHRELPGLWLESSRASSVSALLLSATALPMLACCLPCSWSRGDFPTCGPWSGSLGSSAGSSPKPRCPEPSGCR